MVVATKMFEGVILYFDFRSSISKVGSGQLRQKLRQKLRL